MNIYAWSLVLAVFALLSGCGTPSIHPLASEDTTVRDPALVGTWAKADAGKDEAIYRIEESGDHYTLTVEHRESDAPEKWVFEVKLVELGKYRFVDVQAAEPDRKSVDKRWASFFVPTHLFGRYAIEGGTLKFWMLNQQWLEKSLSEQKFRLAHTSLDHDWVLITAETADLQAFLRAHAEDSGAFDRTDLMKIKP